MGRMPANVSTIACANCRGQVTPAQAAIGPGASGAAWPKAATPATWPEPAAATPPPAGTPPETAGKPPPAGTPPGDWQVVPWMSQSYGGAVSGTVIR